MAQAIAQQATTDKQLALEKRGLYQGSESPSETGLSPLFQVDFDDDKLKLPGGRGRKPPNALEAPGQARHIADWCYRLEVPR